MYRRLYHVSPKRNRISVHALGVNPAFSRGKRKATWWVTEDKLAWAIDHVCTRDNLTPDDLTIYTAGVHHMRTKGCYMPGVFYVPYVVRPHAEIELNPLLVSDTRRKAEI
jgi:hypothetical protein